MSSTWSRLEVEVVVSDYLDMLGAELRGDGYNKTAHRRTLKGQLRARTDGSIERKHQNISAVLLELGYPYVFGYKPLGNYQALLFDVVAERVAGDVTLARTVENDIARPAHVPSVTDILERLERAPEPSAQRLHRVAEVPHQAATGGRAVDYIAREAKNASLGRAGEEFVLNFERARLIHAGKENLAERVAHVAVSVGDGLGFDIQSYEQNGRDRLIEVKTTAYGKATPFFVTRNELGVSQDCRAEYHLYRVFRFRADPRLFALHGALDQVCALDPVQFSARVA